MPIIQTCLNYKKQSSVKLPYDWWLGEIGKPHFPNKHILWDISIYQIKCFWEPEFIIQAFSSH